MTIICIVTMTGNKSVTATFTLNNYTLTVSKTGTGSGTITGTGISCGPDCTETYPYNTPVTITAIPDATSDFTGWTGCDSTNSNTCTVTMTGNRSVSASFTRRTHDLTVGKSGTGTGTVTGTGINCGTDCSENYVYGTVVNLTASANTGSTFTGWTGCDSVNSNTCTVTMTSNKIGQCHLYLQPVYPDGREIRYWFGHHHRNRNQLRHRLHRSLQLRDSCHPHRYGRYRFRVYLLERV